MTRVFRQTPEEALERVAVYLNADAAPEYERHHFGEGDTFDPCLSLPTGHLEAVEVEYLVEEGKYIVTERGWDATGGLDHEKVLYHRVALPRMVEQVACDAVRKRQREQERVEAEIEAGPKTSIEEALERSERLNQTIREHGEVMDRAFGVIEHGMSYLIEVEKAAKQALADLDAYVEAAEQESAVGALSARRRLRKALERKP